MKRILSLTLALVMVLGTFTAVFAAEPTVEEVAGAFLEKVGVLVGDDEGDLLLEENLERRDAVILLSRLLDQEEVAKEFPTSEESPSWTDARTDAYYVPFFAWAEANKYFEGNDDGTFAPREAITAQEYALVLLRALGYEATGHDAWKAALETAKELGLLVDVEVKDADKVLRGQMAVMTLNALGTNMKDSDKTLAEELGIELPVPAVLEVEEVKADNLKEIQVVFNKAVDRDNVEDKANYSTTAGAIKDAQLMEENVVVLTLEDGVKMKDKKEYKLDIRGIKDGDSSVNTEFKFTARDNSIPEVVEVEGLGTKAVKVVMSEPVQNVKSSSFAIDGKTYYGSVSVTGREIILKPYSSLSVGEHKLVVKSLEDYAGFKSVEREFPFEIVEDKDAPEVVDAKGTLERVVVTFSEPVDDATVSRDTLYWGGLKSNKAEKVVRLSGNRYAFEFSPEKALPTYEVKLTVKGVKDYSGNEMKEQDVLFQAEIDTTRPEVVEVKIEDGNLIIVRFNKAVNGDDVEKRDNFALLDEDGKKVSIRTPYRDASDYRIVKIGLYSDLAENKDYTLKISGLRDITKLANSMLPYEEVITAGNYKNPKAEETVIPSVDRDGIVRLQVTFNKRMDVETIADPSNYFVSIDGTEYLLSVIDGDVDVVQDGKAVVLVMPEEIKISGSKVTVYSLFDEIEYVKVLAVKDTAGNILSNYGAPLDVEEGVLEVKEAIAKDSLTIEVEFNQTITNASRTNFEVVGRRIDRVVTKGNKKVTIELVDRDGNELEADLEGEEVKVYGQLETILGKLNVVTDAGEDYKSLTKANELLKDEIKPSLIDVEASISTDKKELELTLIFDEDLNTASAPFAASDFIIKRTDGKKLDINKMTPIIRDDKLILTTTQMFGTETQYSEDKAYEVDTIATPNGVRDIANNTMNKLDKVLIVEEYTSHTSSEEGAAKVAATEAVETAEAEKTQENVEAAQALVDVLPDGDVKEALQGRLDAVQADIDAAAIAEATEAATEAVETAEAEKTQENVEAAQALVDVLPDGDVKTDLEERLAAVQVDIDAAAIAAATEAVETAEASKEQADVEAAQALVDALPDGETKTILNYRLGEIEVVTAP